MSAICFTLLRISLPIVLWKENRDSLYIGNSLLCGNCHHIAAISQFKMAATLLDMQFSTIDRFMSLTLSVVTEKVVITLHFVQISAISNFTMTAALPVIFSVIEHNKIPVHVSLFSSSMRSRSHHILQRGCIPGLP